MRLSDVLTKHKADHLGRAITGKQIGANLQQIINLLGDPNCNLLDQKLLDSLSDRLQADGYANATINNRITAFLSMIKWGVGRLGITTDFLAHQRLPESPRSATLTKEQVSEILSKLDGEAAVFVRLLWLTGQRLEAVSNLTWEQIKPDRIDFMARVQARQKHRAVTPITDPIRITIDRLGAPGKGRIFTLSTEQLVRRLRRAGEACGVSVHPHMLRHSVITAMIEAGEDLLQVSKFAGHGNVATTQKHYLHTRPEFFKKAMGAVAI